MRLSLKAHVHGMASIQVEREWGKVFFDCIYGGYRDVIYCIRCESGRDQN